MNRPAPENRLSAGVIGVGHMGSHHARVYSELPGVDLVGVTDVDDDRRREVARKHGTAPMSRDELLSAADLVSVAVPTRYHYETAIECIDAGVDLLVEKPFVADARRGRELIDRADSAGVTMQVGYVERFNPAVRVLSDVVPDLDVLAVDVDRRGPPLDRAFDDNVVMDLMVHDIDILRSVLGTDVKSLSATGPNDRHVTSQFQFEDGSVAVLTASRVTQQKIRRLAITAEECRVNVDFIAQTVEIHRRSLPEYVESDGDVRYRQESLVERPMVENGEPLKAELRSFVAACREGTTPEVTPEDALWVLEVARQIESDALPEQAPEVPSR